MGLFNSKLSFCSSHDEIIRPDDVIIVKDLSEAIILEKRYKNIVANYLIGYNYKIEMNIQNYVKYENGLYLYSSPMMNASLLFGKYRADIINNFRVNNRDVEMLIRIERVSGDKTIISDIYDAENFDLKYVYAYHNYRMSFEFISTSPILEAFSISTTKFIAGPESFRQKINKRFDVNPIYITGEPLKDSPFKTSLEDCLTLLFGPDDN